MLLVVRHEEAIGLVVVALVVAVGKQIEEEEESGGERRRRLERWCPGAGRRNVPQEEMAVSCFLPVVM